MAITAQAPYPKNLLLPPLRIAATFVPVAARSGAPFSLSHTPPLVLAQSWRGSLDSSAQRAVRSFERSIQFVRNSPAITSRGKGIARKIAQ